MVLIDIDTTRISLYDVVYGDFDLLIENFQQGAPLAIQMAD